ncbi:MAG: acyltransferase [Pseudobutyrivibrio sp.]|nr:acyltransferase [Pseudobutyrivibrio sp.]
MISVIYWVLMAVLLSFSILFTANISINWLVVLPIISIGAIISIVKSKKNPEFIQYSLAIKPSNRIPVYDYIRCLAVILVVVFHTLNWDLNEAADLSGTGLYMGLDSLRWWTLVCNALFIMISGALLLPYKEESVIEFYKKRLIRIAIPLIVYFIWYLWQYDKLKAMTPWEVVVSICTADVDNSNVNHFWIIYMMLLIYVTVPFLRGWLKKLSYAQLTGLVFAIFVFSAVGIFTPIFGYSIITLIGYIFVAILGYWVTREESRKYDIELIIIGVACSGIMFKMKDEFAYFEPLVHNLSILRLGICLGIFSLFIKLKHCLKDNYILRIINKYSYSIMLIHMWALYFVTRKLVPISSVMYHGLGLIVSALITMIISTIAAYLIDNLIVNIFMSFLTIKNNK